MSSFSDYLEKLHPLDELGKVAAAESQELARLFGSKATDIGGPVGTSSLPEPMAKQYWADHRQPIELVESAEDFTSSQPIYAEEVQGVTLLGLSESSSL